MPYIDQKYRHVIDIAANNLAAAIFNNGSLNYAISKLIHRELKTRFLNYENLNDIMGVLECVKQEFYRTVVAPYEDKKRLENGSVSELDDNRDKIMAEKVNLEKTKKCKVCGSIINWEGLCFNCEDGLENFKGSVELLRAAIYYLNPMEKIR